VQSPKIPRGGGARIAPGQSAHRPDHRPTKPKMLAVVATDLHLRETPPVSRAEKGDEWLAAQAGYLKQLRDLKDKYKIPLLIGGDFFHKWNSSAALINFALEHLPDCYGIPGNHDLPYHDLSLVNKSAYWTLVLAGKVTDMPYGSRFNFGDELEVDPFPFGTKLTGRLTETKSVGVQMALVHQYVWYATAKYPDAPAELHAARFEEPLKGYDCAAFGDNHKGFWVRLPSGCTIFNCGAVYNAKSDEVGYKPHVGLVTDHGNFIRIGLDTSKDRWVDDLEDIKDRENEKDEDLRQADFILSAARLGDHAADFAETVRRMVEGAVMSEGAKRIALAALERKK
jgi:hypothetical protein